MNSKKIFENGNETKALRDKISETIEGSSKEYMKLRERMNKEITFLKDENEELKKANQKVESSLKDINMVEAALEKIKEEIRLKNEETSKEYIELRDSMNQENKFLKDENEDLKKAKQKSVNWK